jgi:hypothetical protein
MWQRKEAQKELKHAITFHGVSLMNKIYLPTVGPQDWQKLLADPEKCIASKFFCSESSQKGEKT